MKPPVSDMLLLLPEITVLTMACAILVFDVFLGKRHREIVYYLSQATLVAAAAVTIGLYTGDTSRVLSGTFISDGMGDVLKIFIYIVMFGVFAYSRDYLRVRDFYKGEYFVLALFGMLGMMVMVSAHNLLTIYLGLELLSLCMYAMVAMQRDSAVVSEAAMKYFVPRN